MPQNETIGCPNCREICGSEERKWTSLYETFYPSFTEMVERLWSDFEPWTRRKAERPESLTVDVALSPQETLTGGQVRILVQGGLSVRPASAKDMPDPTNAHDVRGMERSEMNIR